MSHGHDHTHKINDKPTKKLLLILFATFIYMIAEAVGGVLTNSLSLLADAGHMLADVSAVCISLAAFYISSRPATDRSTFGFQRAEVIAALFNGVILLVSSFFIVKEAIIRLVSPKEEIEAEQMIIIAFGGLLINIASLLMLNKDKDKNLNLKGAWLHILSDTLGSIAVIISGLAIEFFKLEWFDSAASILICLLIVFSAISLISKTLSVLMEQVPTHIHIDDVEKIILSHPLVKEVHDLHVWSLTIGNEAMSAHVVVNEKEKSEEILSFIQREIKEKIGISHLTIQIETKCNDACFVC